MRSASRGRVRRARRRQHVPLQRVSAPYRSGLRQRRLLQDIRSSHRRAEQALYPRRAGRPEGPHPLLPELRQLGLLGGRSAAWPLRPCRGCLRRSPVSAARGLGLGAINAFPGSRVRRGPSIIRRDGKRSLRLAVTQKGGRAQIPRLVRSRGRPAFSSGWKMCQTRLHSTPLAGPFLFRQRPFLWLVSISSYQCGVNISLPEIILQLYFVMSPSFRRLSSKRKDSLALSYGIAPPLRVRCRRNRRQARLSATSGASSSSHRCRNPWRGRNHVLAGSAQSPFEPDTGCAQQ